MKVIDLLNKIANKEEVPHFIIDEQEYYLGADGFLKELYGDEVEWTLDAEWLNTEIEIIEEPKEIEKLKNTINYYINYEDDRLNEDISHICRHLISHIDKINELIDVVNELKKENK